MPGVGTPELIAAVSNGGGLGMIGAPLIPPPLLAEALDAVAKMTAKPFGVNFWFPFSIRNASTLPRIGRG